MATKENSKQHKTIYNTKQNKAKRLTNRSLINSVLFNRHAIQNFKRSPACL